MIVDGLRRLLRLPAGIGREEAVEIAKKQCRKQDWPWEGRILAWGGLSSYGVVTNAEGKGN